MMRIITGSARGIKLDTLEGEATRPTAERVKEALFSMLQFDIEGRRVLELFAGSGQLALEALSRGAVSAVLVDNSRDAINIIKSNAQKTKLAPFCEIYNCEYGEYIRKSRGSRFDIIFLDPPYAKRLCGGVLEALFDADMLKESSIVVCESEEEDIFEGRTALAGRFEILKKARYGRAYLTIVTPKGSDE